MLLLRPTGALTDETSLFTYPEGENTHTYTNDSFVPIFLSEVNATVRADAEAMCGGAEDLGCIFDYIATGDAALAVNTRVSSQDAKTAQEVAGQSLSLIHISEPTRRA